jgi:hypothetical protein
MIWFRSAAEMLDTFGLQQGGTQYRRLMAAFQRVFGATIFFGTDTQRDKAAVVHKARFSFMSEARIWYSRNSDQRRYLASFRTRSFSVRSFSKKFSITRYRQTWRPREHFRVRPRRSIFSPGCHTGASQRKAASGYHSSGPPDW